MCISVWQETDLAPHNLAVSEVQAGNDGGSGGDKHLWPPRRELRVLHLAHVLQRPVHVAQLALLDQGAAVRQEQEDKQQSWQRQLRAAVMCGRCHAVVGCHA